MYMNYLLNLLLLLLIVVTIAFTRSFACIKFLL